MNNLSPDEAVYFGDAVHPEHQSRPSHGWVKKDDNIAIKCNSGRQRVNIHGALNLENFDLPFEDVWRVNSQSTIALMGKIESRNKDKSKIYLILDNAAYHRSKEVRRYLARDGCKIKVIWLPAYCPHLNPIERLWGVLHKNVTHNRHYPTIKEFGTAILNFLMNTVPKNWQKFTDTVTDNFRVIAKNQFKIAS